ncbi:tripartite tricarboxylate transporter TctB family protein [Ancylobacter terrae]|uniref:tripartite tricarboxylate transporter TctB family protein n=1 Tax=Ancylobacter sp. sgz301288 TaxID=3342077 RepID=UPI00385CD7F5
MTQFEKLVRDGDLWAGAALAGLGVHIVSRSYAWTYIGPSGPGPGFFPIWYGAIMVVLSLALIVSRVVRADGDVDEPADWWGVGRALVTWAAFVVAAALMPFIGFVTGFALLCLFLIRIVFQRSLMEAVIASIGITALFHVIFVMLLQLDLPVGPLGI